MKAAVSLSIFVFAMGLGSAFAQGQQSATGTLIPGRETSSPVASVGTVGRGATGSDTYGEAQPTVTALNVARTTLRCVIKKRPDSVQAMLVATDRAQLLASYHSVDLIFTDCAARSARGEGFQLGMGRGTLMGLAAEASLARNRIPVLAEVPYTSQISELDWTTEQPGTKIVLRLASCLSSTKPQQVVNLLYTAPASAGEAAAFGALAPAFPSCLERNTTLKTGKSGLRLALALSYYRRILNPISPLTEAGGKK